MKKNQLERLPLRPRRSNRDRRIQGLDIIILVILLIYSFLIIFPFWNAFVISISSESAYLRSNMLLWPTELDLSSYKHVFTDNQLWSGFGITMILLIGGTLYQLFFTVITGYALSRHKWTGKNFVMNMILIHQLYSYGAAIASVISEVIITAVQLYFIRNELSIPKIFSLSWKYLISAVCMLIVLFLMDVRLSVSFMHTMIMIVTGFIVYMVLLVLMRDEMVWEGIRLIKTRIKRH